MKLAVSAAVLFAAAVCGQTASNNAQSFLSLTDSQLQALKQLRQQHRQATAPIMQQMRQKQQSLDTQMSSSNAAGVGQLMLEMKALRDNMTAAQATYRNSALGLLTADQKTKLQQLEQAAALRQAIGEAAGLGLLSAEDGMHRGPGGPDFRGGPHGHFGGPPPSAVQQ
jgi:Spy/CpxP family protein refolding chaperone